MLNRIDLERLRKHMQRIIRDADPELARSLVAEPPRDPDEPRLFEYLDRLLAALAERIADPTQVASHELKLLLRYVRRLRLTSAEQWDMR